MIGNGLAVKTKLLFFLVAKATKGKIAEVLIGNVLPGAQ
jgi:hypothetical protein